MLRRFVLLAAGLALALPASALSVGKIHDHQEGHGRVDTRAGSVAPTAAQMSAVEALGATVRWNRYGTPASLSSDDGFLAEGLTGEPADAARAFLAANKALFRLSDTSAAALELVNASALGDSGAHVVLFRQRFGELRSGQDGLITVGLASNGRVAYVSSSAAGDRAAPEAATLTAQEAWTRAAASVGRNVSVVELANVSQRFGWTMFNAPGFAQLQQARLVAFPTLNAARPAFEANVVDVEGGETLAHTAFVDAVTGEILFRTSRVDHLEAPTAQTYSGSYTPTSCGSYHDFTVPAGTRSIDVTAAAPGNDIILELHRPQGTVVASSDIPAGPNPESIHYEPVVLEPGVYSVRVCPFDAAQVPPYTYTGTFAATPLSGEPVSTNPKWRFFTANPPLDLATNDSRILGCWATAVQGLPVPGCDLELQNTAARLTWDFDPRTNSPTFTTKGNAASSGEAWLSPLTPAEQYRPVSATRTYDFPWANQWQTSGCSPSVFASPQRNDIDAAASNLFVEHNRMHDWSYYLGFTEQNYNMQESNFGGPGKGNDPEVGNVQAGAVSGGAPSYLGRDNANQISLQDGIPGITNMYLWQPIAGAFYAPCVDGDYDMSVIGHEYTHAISNRMVAGPDGSLTGDQSRAMGESWSDLAAVEYLNEHGYVPTNGENPFAVGPYATGAKQTGIRNYAMNDSPLNYSDVGYDFVCNADPAFNECYSATQVHADGEIWSATNFDLRKALIDKYGAGDPALQLACAKGEQPAGDCPGNRRWIQIMFDAFLLMQSDVSMVDARDAYLAADRMRFGGANQAELWKVFASRGLGEDASSGKPATETSDEVGSGDDVDPVPSFASPLAEEETLSFSAVDETGAAVEAQFFVGDYEARVTPIADTDPSTTSVGASAPFVAGSYDFVAQAAGHGLVRFSVDVDGAGTRDVKVAMPTNWASRANGAVASGDGVNLDSLIDDTEGSTWAALAREPDVAGTQVTVDLAGGARLVKSVNVSAMQRLRDTANTADPGSQSRFAALRAFDIQTCNAAVQNCDPATGTGFATIYSSAEDAFPSGIPRPLAPTLIFRSFDVPDTQATHVRLVVRSNQCTGGPAYQGEQDTDPTNATDCSEANANAKNVRAAELQVFTGSGGIVVPPSGPDLRVSDVELTGASTSRPTATATVTNAGNAAAGASSTGFTLDGTRGLCTVATPGIAAGASTTVTCRFRRDGATGQHTLTATADKAAQVAETDETNNSRTETFGLGG